MYNLCGSLLDRWYNVKFNLTSYIYDIDKQLRQNDKVIYILNETIKNDVSIEQRIEKLKNICSQIIWFSYRKKITQFQISSLTSDTGWGCMIRVAQMALAQVIRHYHSFTQPEQLIVLIRHFLDNDDDELTNFIEQDQKKQVQYYHAPFSIQKIVYHAKIEFKKKPGDWYKPNEILETLYYLFKYSQYSLNMQIYINYQCAFILQDAIQQMFNYDKGNQEWLKECITNNNQLISQHDKGIAIFIPARIGLQKVDKEYLEVLNHLMTLPYFQGIIGGVTNRAFYIVGRIHDYLIYLDPHFVQNAQNFEDLSKSQTSYTCQNVQLIHNQSIDPSIVVCLCIRNGLELLNFWHSNSKNIFLFHFWKQMLNYKCLNPFNFKMKIMNQQIFQNENYILLFKQISILSMSRQQNIQKQPPPQPAKGNQPQRNPQPHQPPKQKELNAEDYAKPPHLTKEEVLEVKQAFDIFDGDGSGAIDPQELREAFEASGIKTYHNKFIYQVLGELDTDNSGGIDFEEFLHLATAKVSDKDTREQIHKVFNLYDWNKEGRITWDELKRVAQDLGEEMTDEEIQHMFKKADLDDDGFVTFDDFYNLMTQKEYGKQ
ncbi:unnamed protein product [Paramecium octaurelia]|uniref:Cysteine protease n=1 Tax=Paramecium octaurelia TaxID=43137 RepID=A0A8S1TB92_PAROT|nr:unnamed protein product [Paramecium octaurelia]